MLKKLRDYEQILAAMAGEGRPLTPEQLLSVRTHIAFFQHERLVHELVMILFAILSVGGVFFFAAIPQIPVFLPGFAVFCPFDPLRQALLRTRR